ncbi:MAG: hypothetical protein ACFFD1_04295 [Candidatus Thorarchaeota archaeon]
MEKKLKEKTDEVIPLITVDKEILDFLYTIPEKLSPIIAMLCKEKDLPLVDIIPVGSAFRNTILPQKIELDLFVRFDTRDIRILSTFANLIVAELANYLNLPYEIKYAENPYGTVFFISNKYHLKVPIDVVATIWTPDTQNIKKILKISGMARTPFHMTFLKEWIKNKELEVRLFKFWCKRKYLYGQCGFTGFLCELLIGKYDTFLNLLGNYDEINKLAWDPSNRMQNPNKLRRKFYHDLIIIMDPIDENRNAAAGIQGFYGTLQLKRFSYCAKNNLKFPEQIWQEIIFEEPYFRISIEFSIEIMNRTNDEILSRKIAIVNALARQFEVEEINIIDAYVENNDIFIKTDRMDSIEYIRKGPRVIEDKFAKKFLEKNPGAFEKDKRLWIKDRYLSSGEVINKFLASRKEINFHVTKISTD